MAVEGLRAGECIGDLLWHDGSRWRGCEATRWRGRGSDAQKVWYDDFQRRRCNDIQWLGHGGFLDREKMAMASLRIPSSGDWPGSKGLGPLWESG